MKVDSLAKESSAIGSSQRDSSSGVAALLKQIFTGTRSLGEGEDKISYWQLVFLQSKANGCSYRDEDLLQYEVAMAAGYLVSGKAESSSERSGIVN